MCHARRRRRRSVCSVGGRPDEFNSPFHSKIRQRPIQSNSIRRNQIELIQLELFLVMLLIFVSHFNRLPIFARPIGRIIFQFCNNAIKEKEKEKERKLQVDRRFVPTFAQIKDIDLKSAGNQIESFVCNLNLQKSNNFIGKKFGHVKDCRLKEKVLQI
jgi:hypothetical protein